MGMQNPLSQLTLAELVGIERTFGVRHHWPAHVRARLDAFTAAPPVQLSLPF